MKNILHVKLLLKITQEYVNSHFTFVFSLLFSLLFLAYSYNFSSNSWRPVVLLFFIIYAITTAYVAFVNLRIKKDLAKHGDIQKSTRMFGYPLLVTILSGNIFSTSFAFMLVSKSKTAEYTFAAYAFITQLFILGIAALNLFKPYVTDTFLLAMGVFWYSRFFIS